MHSIKSCDHFSSPYGWQPMLAGYNLRLTLIQISTWYGFSSQEQTCNNAMQVARRVSYEALGETKENIQKHLTEHPFMDGIVAGDEARLRQIITNLARCVS
jgi:hypothetical protein